MWKKPPKAIKLTSPFIEYADTTHGSVASVLGAIDSDGQMVCVYLEDPKIARVLSTNLFEWAIREELRAKYDGS